MPSNDDVALACQERRFLNSLTPRINRAAQASARCVAAKKEQHVQQLDLSRDADDRAPYRRWNH